MEPISGVRDRSVLLEEARADWLQRAHKKPVAMGTEVPPTAEDDKRVSEEARRATQIQRVQSAAEGVTTAATQKPVALPGRSINLLA